MIIFQEKGDIFFPDSVPDPPLFICLYFLNKNPINTYNEWEIFNPLTMLMKS